MNTNTLQNHLYLFAKGLPEYEQKIIEATAKISQSRSLAIDLVNESQAESAQVIIIDGINKSALAWADSNWSWLQSKAVIWIDTAAPISEHSNLQRPVLWVNLPILISRILDDIETKKLLRKEKRAQDTTHTGQTDSPERPHKATILVCDDSEAVRRHLHTLLHQWHYQAKTVECGEEAVAAAKEQQFDCILMDVLMPGIDGYRTCREILRSGLGKRDTPVIMLTSKTSPFDKIRGKMSGCSAYLTKPVTKRELLDTIEQHVRRK